MISHLSVLAVILPLVAPQLADAHPIPALQPATHSATSSTASTSQREPDSGTSLQLFKDAQRTDLDLEQRLQHARRLWQHSQSGQDQVYGRVLEAAIQVQLGEVDRAEQLIDKATAIAGTRGVHAEVLLWTLLSTARTLESVREDAAIRAAFRCVRLADLLNSTHYRIQARVVLSRIAARHGAYPRALEYLEPAANFALRKINDESLLPHCVAMAEGLLRYGKTARSEHLFSKVLGSEATGSLQKAEARLGLARVRLAEGDADLAELASRSLFQDLSAQGDGAEPDGPGSSVDRDRRVALRIAAGCVLAESLRDQSRYAAGLAILDQLDTADCPDPVIAAELQLTRAQVLFRSGQHEAAFEVTAPVSKSVPNFARPYGVLLLEAALLAVHREIQQALGREDAALEAALRESEFREQLRSGVDQWQVHLTTVLAGMHPSTEFDRQNAGIEPQPQPEPLEPGEIVASGPADASTAVAQLSRRQFYEAEEAAAARANQQLTQETERQNQATVSTLQLVTGAGLLVLILYLIMDNSRKLASQKAQAAEEFRELEEQLNQKLTEELELRTQQLESELQHREKMERALEQTRKAEAIARLTSGVAHDFNNLMMVVIASNEVLRLKATEQSDSSMVDLIDDATSAAQSASDITQQLLAYSRKQPLKPRDANVGKYMQQLFRLLQRTMGDRITAELSIECPQLAIRIDSAQLTTALINLCANARDAIDGTGRVIVTVSRAEMNDGALNWGKLPDGEYVVISVADNGQGMTEEQCRRATEPFFTTKADGKTVAGVGLGLSVVDGFLRQSGGMLRIESALGFGTEVSCIIPVAEAEPAATPHAVDPFALPMRKILIVDDDGPVRRAIESSLSAHGFQTWTASHADEAMEIVETGNCPRLVLTDVRMRGKDSGIDLARWLKDNHPDIRVVLMTGFAEQVAGTGFDVISKPFQIAELVERIQVAA